jgi:hypothetical protein
MSQPDPLGRGPSGGSRQNDGPWFRSVTVRNCFVTYALDATFNDIFEHFTSASAIDPGRRVTTRPIYKDTVRLTSRRNRSPCSGKHLVTLAA